MGWINPTDSDEMIEKPKNIETDMKSKIAEITKKSVKPEKTGKISFETKNSTDQDDRKSVF